MKLETIDRRWAGRRCIVAASGPSLTPEVAAACQGDRVIAVNDAYKLLPWADVLYACDAAWFEAHNGSPKFAGEKWSSHGLSPKNDKTGIADKFGLRVIAGEDREGFSLDPARIHYGHNSGYQAVNLAILFGADPIILVGFDMRAVDQRLHFFGNHPAPLRTSAPFAQWRARFHQAAQMLGSTPRIINCTPESALKCFPMMPLAEALDGRMAA